MRSATLFGYQLALDAGVVLREQRLKSRLGMLVKLVDEHGEGWGEIAPLPQFSTESPEQAQIQAVKWLERWCRGDRPPESPLPSVAFGISCARAELAGQLPAEGCWQSAHLCSGDPDTLFEHLQNQPAPLAKMKVGLYEAVRDGMQVNLLLEALPGLTLRLDANRSWTLEKALQFARYISTELRGRIAFIEEPCRTVAESMAFARQTGIAIAWDESLRDDATLLSAQQGVRAVVIKPTLTGSIQKVQQQVAAAQRLGLIPVLSSSLESSLGLTQLARLAQQLTPGIVPGLDTLSLMQMQLLRRWPGCTLPLSGKEDLQCLWQQ